MDLVKTVAADVDRVCNQCMGTFTEPALGDLLQLLSMLSIPGALLLTIRHLNRRDDRRVQSLDGHRPHIGFQSPLYTDFEKCSQFRGQTDRGFGTFRSDDDSRRPSAL